MHFFKSFVDFAQRCARYQIESNQSFQHFISMALSHKITPHKFWAGERNLAICLKIR